MKYLKIVLIVFYILFVPFFVFAEDICQNSDVIITDISLNKSLGNTEELEEATIQNNSVQMNVKMYEVGDSIEYNITLKNQGTEDYILENNIQNSNEYINYSIEPKSEHDYKIETNEEKDYVLKVMYTREVGEEEFLSGKYNASSNPIVIVRDNTLINPETGTIILYIFGLLFIINLFIPFKNKVLKVSPFIILLGIYVLPTYTHATCSDNIELHSDIVIGYVIPNPCTYDGNLVQGATYTNGQYTYVYKKKYGYNRDISDYALLDMEDDGWTVFLTDKTSMDPVTTTLCTSINDKPIVSMDHTFKDSQATSIDLSSFDTSNVVSMRMMFYGTKLASLDVSNFNTENVTDYMNMFSSTVLTELDMSGFDLSRISLGNYYSIPAYLSLEYTTTLKTLKMNYVDIGTLGNGAFKYLYNVETMELNHLNVSECTSFSYMFGSDRNLVNLQMNDWNAENVTDISYMFDNCANIKKIDLSIIHFPKLQNMSWLFTGCSSLEEVNVSGVLGSTTTTSNGAFNTSSLKRVIADDWVVSSINSVGNVFNSRDIEYVSIKNWVMPQDLTDLFYQMRAYGIKNIDVTGWDTSNTTNFYKLFREMYSMETITGINTWDTSKVTSLSSAFIYFSKLEELDLRGWDFSSITNVNEMVRGSHIKAIYVGEFNAENLEDASYMFAYGGNIETITFDSASLPKLNTTYYMFSNLSKLTTLDLGEMDISHTTDLKGMFNGCSILTTLDLSSFDINNNMQIDFMFSGCNNLQTVYVKDQATANKLSNSSLTTVPSTTNFVVKT